MDEPGVEVRDSAGRLLGWMAVREPGSVERTVRFPLRAPLGRTAAAWGLMAEAPPVLALDLRAYRTDTGERLIFHSGGVPVETLRRVAVFRDRQDGAKG